MPSQAELEAFDNIRKNTVRYKVKHIVGNTLSNLEHVCNVKSATSYTEKPLLGQPAVVVAAGPSLDSNVMALHEAQQAGRAPFVFCVNTAAPALKRAGIWIDAIVSLESVDVSNQIMEAGMVISAISAHPNTFRKSTHWFAPFSPHNRTICKYLRSHPIHIGDSVATAAVSLALDWGANTVILMGQDLAYTGGRCYASGTPWEQETAEDEGGMVVFHRPPAKDEWRQEQGVPRLPEKRDGFMVTAWDGNGQLQTTTEMVAQVRWYEGLARLGRYQQNGHKVRFINATEGGALIRGWLNRRASEVLWAHNQGKHPSNVKFFSAGPNQRGEVMQAMAHEVQAARHMAESLMNGRPVNWVAQCKGMPFIGGMTLGAVLSLSDKDKTAWTERERMVYRFQCWLEAANTIDRMMGATQ